MGGDNAEKDRRCFIFLCQDLFLNMKPYDTADMGGDKIEDKRW